MLFSEIHHFTDPTGRALSEPFLRLPSRRFVKLLYLSLAAFILETSYWDRLIIYQTDILFRYKSENKFWGTLVLDCVEAWREKYYQKQYDGTNCIVDEKSKKARRREFDMAVQLFIKEEYPLPSICLSSKIMFSAYCARYNNSRTTELNLASSMDLLILDWAKYSTP